MEASSNGKPLSTASCSGKGLVPDGFAEHTPGPPCQPSGALCINQVIATGARRSTPANAMEINGAMSGANPGSGSASTTEICRAVGTQSYW